MTPEREAEMQCRKIIKEMILKIIHGMEFQGLTTVAIPAGKLQLCALEWALRSGNWLPVKGRPDLNECSYCHAYVDGYDNYCKLCGADMNAENDEKEQKNET